MSSTGRTRTIGLVVAVESPYEQAIPGQRPPLLLGMFCEVELRAALQEGRIVIPRSALHDGSVYVVDGERRLRRREVSIAFAQSGFLCLERGLEPGELLVVSDPTPAVDGLRTEPIIDEEVEQRLEDALDGVRFVEEARSDVRDGLAIVTVEMEPEGSYQAFKDEIDTAIAAIDDFPPEVEDPVITQLHTTDLVLSILISGPMPTADLKAYCEDFKERLQQRPEVSLVRIRGFSDHQLRVELSEEALRRFGLDAAAVADIVRRQSVNLPAGSIETRDDDITVRFVEERRSPLELEQLVIVAGEGGAEIRLGDIARVRDLFEPEEEQVLVGGERAGLLHVEMTRNQDVIRVADVVKRFTQAERERYPALQFTVTQDSSTLVRDRLRLLVTNGSQGMLLVFLTLWLFFHVRLSFWVVLSLPISFLGAMFVMPYLGLTINMMTMLGMLLALGILMDDGIVIAENIATHRAGGKPGLQAAVDGVREVQGGVLPSFITTVCVLGPLAFLAGDIGKVLEVVPLVVMAAIPLALIGVVAGHLLMRIQLSMPSVLGFVSLAGIVVNDSLLLVLFLKAGREQGNDALASAAEASRQRFRAVLLTSLTTIAGLLPLLATSIAFGLMASTILVLLVIPCLYAILDDLGWTARERRSSPEGAGGPSKAADSAVPRARG